MVNLELKKNVFDYLKTLKRGEFTTYKALAQKFNSHPRAIGKIISSNNDKSVPCYKVVRSDGKIGGYNGLLGKSKEELLREEGIPFNSRASVLTKYCAIL